ncbi:VOC family protein [Naumannella halotolerans]|uniref:Glyoxalase/Bleomycin resistance-like N-terminal domain-containing protein n=1 Tax=Naumannella halotolerans TaxID=993414 RepID=A0A4R7J173_9ACTN|nr:glyoxalase [Naumannella halotolerans]TDT30850.1 hypothetical protein CLV29_2256 [Naumannella halotolerans]
MQNQMTFINLPVVDTAKAQQFFVELGYEFDPGMCQEGKAHTMRVNSNTHVMLLERSYFNSFHDGRPHEPGTHEQLLCVSADSRDQVDQQVDKAIGLGAAEVRNCSQDLGFMYSRAFTDLDGHVWEWMYFDPSAAAESN